MTTCLTHKQIITILSGLLMGMFLAALDQIQGLGAGGLMSMALAVMADVIPPRDRARYQGYFMAVFATSSVLGPVVGGFFAGQSTIIGIAGWRWIFWINVPIGLAALLVVSRVLHLNHVRRDHRIDWWGAVALIVALVPLLTVAEQGREWGWTSGRSMAGCVIGVLGVVWFGWTEHRLGDEAMLPLRLFRIGPFAVGAALSFVISIGIFGVTAAIPLYLQIVKGASPTKAGLLILPMVTGIMVASSVAGQVTSRTGRYKIFPIIGSMMLIIGLLLMSQVGADTPLWQTDLYMLLFGAGFGQNMQTIVLAMQNSVPARDMGVATASTMFFRQMGGTLGTAVFLSIIFSSAKTGSARRTRRRARTVLRSRRPRSWTPTSSRPSTAVAASTTRRSYTTLIARWPGRSSPGSVRPWIWCSWSGRSSCWPRSCWP